jgi:phospholipid transport system transporter-binding protein
MTRAGSIKAGENGSLVLTGQLTFDSIPGLYREAQKLLSGAEPVSSVDLSEVTSADSAGLALLLEWQAMQRAASRDLAVRNAPPGLISLARLCEADDVMNISGRDSRP